MADPSTPITFPQYVMQTMHDPGDNRQHLVERVMANVWAETPDCAHVFDVEFVDTTGQWQGVWIMMTEREWTEWLVDHSRRLQHVIDETIEALEDEANKGDDER